MKQQLQMIYENFSYKLSYLSPLECVVCESDLPKWCHSHHPLPNCRPRAVPVSHPEENIAGLWNNV